MSTTSQKKIKITDPSNSKQNKFMSKKTFSVKPSLSLMRDERIRVKNILLTIYNLHQETRGIGDYKMSYVTPITTSLTLEFKNIKHAANMSKELMKKHGFVTSLHNNTITISFTETAPTTLSKPVKNDDSNKKKPIKTNDLSKLGVIVSKQQTKSHINPAAKSGTSLQKTKQNIKTTSNNSVSLLKKEPYEIKRDAILSMEQQQLEQLRINAKRVIQLVKIKFGLGANRKGNTDGYSSGKIMNTKSEKFCMKFPNIQLAGKVETYLRDKEKYTVYRDAREVWIDIVAVPAIGEDEKNVELSSPVTTDEYKMQISRLEHVIDNLKQAIDTSKTSNISISQIGSKIWDYLIQHNIILLDGDHKIQIKDLINGIPMDYDRESFVSLIVTEALK